MNLLPLLGRPASGRLTPGTLGYLDSSVSLRGRKEYRMTVRPGVGPAAVAVTTADVVSTALAQGTADGSTVGATTVRKYVLM